MSKRRVTLDLDEDVIEALESVGGCGVSTTVNDRFRGAARLELHLTALDRWLRARCRTPCFLGGEQSSDLRTL